MDSDEEEWDIDLGSDILGNDLQREEEEEGGDKEADGTLKKKKLFIPPSFRSHTERLAYRKNKVMQIRLNTVLTDLHVQQTTFAKLSSSETQRFRLQRHQAVQHADRRYKRIAWQKACVANDARRRDTLPNIQDVRNRNLRHTSAYVSGVRPRDHNDRSGLSRGRSQTSAQILPLQREPNLVLTFSTSKKELEDGTPPQPVDSLAIDLVREVNVGDRRVAKGLSKSAQPARCVKDTSDDQHAGSQGTVDPPAASEHAQTTWEEITPDVTDAKDDFDPDKLPSIDRKKRNRLRKPEVKETEAAHVRFGRSGLPVEGGLAAATSANNLDRLQQGETDAGVEQKDEELQERGDAYRETTRGSLEDVNNSQEYTTYPHLGESDSATLLQFHPEISKEEKRRNFLKRATTRERELYNFQQQRVAKYLKDLEKTKFLSLTTSSATSMVDEPFGFRW